MFCRCMTKFSVSGIPAAAIHPAASIFRANPPRYPPIRSPVSASVPCSDSCTWSSPAASSAFSRRSVSPIPEVMRLV